MGYKQDEHERALAEVPLFKAVPEQWPDGVRIVATDEFDNLGIDRHGVLHWNGRVITIEKRLVLSAWQKVSAVIVTIGAALVSISTIIQGFAAYNDWACKVGWFGLCPG